MAYSESLIGSVGGASKYVWIRITASETESGTNYTVEGGIRITGQWISADQTYINLNNRGQKSASYTLNSGSYTLDSYTTTVPKSNGFWENYSASCYGYSTYPSGSATASASTLTDSHSVRVNPNGGTLSGSSGDSIYTKSYGSIITLPSAIPVKSGYTFTGYNTLQGGGGSSYSAGGSYGTDKSVRLWAQWRAAEPTSYTVTLDLNGGTGSFSKTLTKQRGVSLSLNGYTPTKTNYIFTEWKISSTGATISPNGSYTIDADNTLIAQWSYKSSTTTYTISYNANGGSGAPSSQTKYSGTSITLSTQVPTRSGYAFMGWATSSSGSAVYQPGYTYSSNSSVTLHAVWKSGVYKYTFTAGSDNKKDFQKETGKPFTLPHFSDIFSGFGYTMYQNEQYTDKWIGMYKDEYGSYQIHSAGEQINVDKDVVFVPYVTTILHYKKDGAWYIGTLYLKIDGAWSSYPGNTQKYNVQTIRIKKNGKWVI